MLQQSMNSTSDNGDNGSSENSSRIALESTFSNSSRSTEIITANMDESRGSEDNVTVNINFAFIKN